MLPFHKYIMYLYLLTTNSVFWLYKAFIRIPNSAKPSTQMLNCNLEHTTVAVIESLVL